MYSTSILGDSILSLIRGQNQNAKHSLSERLSSISIWYANVNFFKKMFWPSYAKLRVSSVPWCGLHLNKNNARIWHRFDFPVLWKAMGRSTITRTLHDVPQVSHNIKAEPYFEGSTPQQTTASRRHHMSLANVTLHIGWGYSARSWCSDVMPTIRSESVRNLEEGSCLQLKIAKFFTRRIGVVENRL